MTSTGKMETAFPAFLGRSVLVLVENLSVPFDRRVWQECRSLRHAGLDVTVISPRGIDRDTEVFEEREGIKIHRFPLHAANGGSRSYLREYVEAVWQIRKLIRALSHGQRFDVVHASNPPDILLLLAMPLRRRDRARLVFDHHDLAPELYLSRFNRRKDFLYGILRLLERLSFHLANVAIATNESYREIAIRRGGKRAEDVFVVRNSPDLAEFVPAKPSPTLKRGKRFLITYVGMMGPQDGVDYALRALAKLANRRTDWHALFVGAGDVLPAMHALAEELGLRNSVEFTGLLERHAVLRVISTADVCLSPEPRNPLNDKSTMIKVAEYMALGRPIVAFDLWETRATAEGAALYSPPNDEARFAERINELLSDDRLRQELGERGRTRVRSALSWTHSEQQLLAAYEHLFRDETKAPGDQTQSAEVAAA